MSFQIKPDSNQFPKWMRWLAQDADGEVVHGCTVYGPKDGTWWGYEHEPHLAEVSWYENEAGLSVLLEKTDINEDWKKTLQKIDD